MSEENTVTLNESSVNAVASALQIDASELTNELTKTEGESEIITSKLNDLEIRTKTDHKTLIENVSKERYDSGKVAGVEMWAKDKKTALGLEGEGLNNPDALLDAYKAKVIADANIEPDAKVEQWNKEKSALQTNVTDLEAKLKEREEQFEQFKSQSTVQNEVLNSVNKVNIVAPEDLVGNQRAMVTQGFLQSHEVRTEDGVQVVYKDNQKLVDGLQNAMPLDVAILSYAKTVVQVGETAQPGRKNIDPNETSLTDGELGKLESEEAVFEYITKQGIDPTLQHKEAMKIVSKWKELKAAATA